MAAAVPAAAVPIAAVHPVARTLVVHTPAVAAATDRRVVVAAVAKADRRAVADIVANPQHTLSHMRFQTL